MIDLQMRSICYGLCHKETLVVKNTDTGIEGIFLISTITPDEKVETDLEIVAATITKFLKDHILLIDQKLLSDLNIIVNHRIRIVESSLYGFFSIFNVIFYSEYRQTLKKEQEIFYQLKENIDFQLDQVALPPQDLSSATNSVAAPPATPIQKSALTPLETGLETFLSVGRIVINAISPSAQKRLKHIGPSQSKPTGLLARLLSDLPQVPNSSTQDEKWDEDD